MSRLTQLSRLQVILLHSLLWICFLFFPLLIYRIDFFTKQFFTVDFINNAFLIALFYINFYYLLPKYFNGKRITAYFVITFAVTLLFMCQQMMTEYFYFHSEMQRHGFSKLHRLPVFPFERHAEDSPMSGSPYHQHHGDSFLSMPLMFWIGGIRRSFSGVVSILLAGGFIRVAIQWFTTEKQKEELEIQRLNDELGLLKAQINPHFLFNSLNTVYSLARKNSADTEGFVLKLSEILRYVIYESSVQNVPLSKELCYIQNYIELQKFRIDKNMRIEYTQCGDTDRLLIEPMLLITFVENAFKHGISYLEGSFIQVNVCIKQNCLHLTVMNTYNKESVASEYGGIGLKNVSKRLQLSYPSLHELNITDDNKTYTVHLSIQLRYD